ncbi:MAG: hypothetical protein OHK93_008224 [Ramalina farinacea]|uniref:Coenzyme Q-binding protein COQ10 START domain-containing protein n=1 Tax=Ramalina farinacea TaxID=258253 RepID=A0AA43QN83_9LECA|nr:hypothetical protein [Ramalina farinacea]
MSQSSALPPWPPSNGLTTKIVPRKSAVFSMYGSTTIAAPGPLIWSVLRDVSNYPKWNTFCPSATIHEQKKSDVSESERQSLHLATQFTLGVVMNAAKPNKKTDTPCRVTDVSTPEEQSAYFPAETLESEGAFSADLGKTWRIAWTAEGNFVARGLRTERFSEIIDVGDGKCVYRTWECQGGVLARTVKWLYEKTLKEKFQLWCDDLKRECERQVQEENSRE